MDRVDDILARYGKLKIGRSQWENTWQELAEVLLPRRADFTVTRMDGDRRTDNVFDSVPIQARRSLASAIDSLFKPRNVQWFHGRPDDDALLTDEDVVRWYEDVDRRMTTAIYEREARFVQRSGEVDNDLVTFGTGVLYIGERAGQPGKLTFRSYHLRDCFVAENSDGVVDTMFLRMRYTARQAAQKWGEENLSRDVREALARDRDTEFEFLWLVQPREDHGGGKIGPKNMPYASLVIDCAAKHVVKESGFEEFPFAVPRWDTASGEVYGRSPGMVALPDAETLQAMGKTLLVAGQRAVDPPMWVLSDGVLSTPRTFPGGITPIDGDAARRFGRPPMGELQSAAQIPLGREMQNDTREQVWGAFFRNVLQLPINAPRMSATEVIERKEEMLRAVGPVFGQLETDYLAVVVERVFGILFRAGKLPPPPEVLLGTDVVFHFESPIMRARKQIEAAGLARYLEMALPLINADPTFLDNYDVDQVARAGPMAGGFPQTWLRSIPDRDALRQARAEQAQAMAQAEMAEKVAGAVGKAGPTLMEMGRGPAAT